MMGNVILAAFLSFLQDAASPFDRADLGIRLKEVPPGFQIRTRDFKLGWPDTICEIVSEDGETGGSVLYYEGLPRARNRADLRETAWKKNGKVERLSDETLPREFGEWVRREVRLEQPDKVLRGVTLYATRGRRNVELQLWAPDAKWDAVRKDLVRLTDALEFVPVWTCPKCQTKIAAGSASCDSCSEPLLPRTESIRNFSRKFGIQIVMNPTRVYPIKSRSGDVTGTLPTKRDVEAFCPILAREIKKYPDEFFRNLELEQIVTCKKLLRGQGPALAIAFMGLDSIHVDVGETDKFATLHHEIFHIVDYREDASMEDKVWEGLNPPDFRYDPNLKITEGVTSRFKGFITMYSLTQACEDKAELYSYLIMDQKMVRVRAGKDAVVAKKVARMKEIARGFCPKMDDAFWKALDK